MRTNGETTDDILSLDDAHLDAGRDVNLQADGTLNLNDATLTDVRPIHIRSDADVLVTRATIDTLGTNHEIQPRDPPHRRQR